MYTSKQDDGHPHHFYVGVTPPVTPREVNLYENMCCMVVQLLKHQSSSFLKGFLSS